jgi:AcrR family transcriptional regulator
MTSAGDPSSGATATRAARRPGRRPYDAGASREALLDAASALFDERGYDAATIREIGQRAGVDAALIARYFGGKEGLYLATLTRDGGRSLPGDAAEALAAMLSSSERRGLGPVPLAMVSPTLTDAMREQIMQVVQSRALEPVAAELAARGTPDPQLRAEILIALALGLSLTRATGTLPQLAAAPLDGVLAIVEPLARALEDPA